MPPVAEEMDAQEIFLICRRGGTSRSRAKVHSKPCPAWAAAPSPAGVLGALGELGALGDPRAEAGFVCQWDVWVAIPRHGNCSRLPTEKSDLTRGARAGRAPPELWETHPGSLRSLAWSLDLHLPVGRGFSPWNFPPGPPFQTPPGSTEPGLQEKGARTNSRE